MEHVNSLFKNGRNRDSIKAVAKLEQILEDTEVNDTFCLTFNNLVAFLHKPKYPFQGLEISASENEVMSNQFVKNRKVSVQLPRELEVGSDKTIVFCMITASETNTSIFEVPDTVYENRLIGLSVSNRNISGLKERVNITINLTTRVNDTQDLRCVFFDFSTESYSEYGCLTIWKRGQSDVTCSCDHLTYFSVLLVSANTSASNVEILTYISLAGCSLSLISLIITVFIFICKRNMRTDIGMKIHINLVVALILLNIHFLPSGTVAVVSCSSLCYYFALSIHYYLLATFSWMALEGFHIYLLLVRVFNIYVKRYLLKLTVVGWGLPAVIVSLVAIIDRDAYGGVPLDLSNPNSTEICYITDDTVKMVTTLGGFCLVFVFNVIMLVVTVRRVLTFRNSSKRDSAQVMQDICTLLGITTLLGLPWGLIFFSFGQLTTPGIYAFCILNSLQGFFIFLWFVMSAIKKRDSASTSSKEMNTTSS
ncbi:adhesion G-protein coupled receptor G1-like [Echeneis naucrates]|nr:adhesion G-protein coupled receptor G1-like [Echeneis naucrates]